MNIVAKSDFNFQGNALVPVSGISGVWLTSADIAKALQYKSAKSITNLFNQNSDEFTGGMTQVIESVTSGNYRKKVRVFSLRGAHLIAMFARTDVAKEFRRWVLDILDREIGSGVVSPSFDFHMHAHHANVVCIHMDFIREVWINELHPALKAIGSPLAVKLYDRIGDASAIAYSLRGALYRADGRKDLH
ncbi:Bro-N domain-containing protein [Serratia sp. UGAL515B_01]|uniref:BRO-N domain-containing protein n=1 Tax=Serratia sp. UGAL515B_01 TaxID=2986763 RepID=UPI003987B60A